MTGPGEVIIVVGEQVGTIPTDQESADEFCAQYSTPEVPVTTQPVDDE